MQSHYQISFYVPEKQCEKVKQAMFAAGAGTLKNYQECSWQTLGRGQFKPMDGSQPFLGKTNKLEVVSEYKVEMLCDTKHIKPAIKALKSSHPYEVPAFFVIKSVIDYL